MSAATLTRDAKTQLNHFCQKFTGRMITKSDVVYSAGRIQTGEFQATVTLNCLADAPQFAGHPANDKRLAEQEAAKQALEAYSEEVAKLQADPMAFKTGKRKQADVIVTRNLTPALGKQMRLDHSAASFTYKLALFEVCQRVIKRSVVKTSDILFTSEMEGEGAAKIYTTTVTLPCLAETCPQGLETYLGEPSKSLKDAEQSAAQKAFDALRLVDEKDFKDAITKVEVKQARAEAIKATREAQASSGGPPGAPGGIDGYSWEEMMEWFQVKGKGKGSGPSTKHENKRYPVSDETYNGTVKYVRRTYGIITPDEPIDHEAAQKRSGDVWFGIRDVIGSKGDTPPDSLVQGANVTFKAYFDTDGLGGEEIIVN